MEAGKHRKMEISILEEWKGAHHSSKIYIERTKCWHDKRIRIKDFKIGDRVLLFISRIKLFGHGKHRSKWDWLFTVTDTSSHGAITLMDDEVTFSKSMPNV